jgi:gamma-glutamyl hydrolase
MVKLIFIDPTNQETYKNKFIEQHNNKDLTAHMVYMPGCGHCDDMKSAWTSACQKYQDPNYKMISLTHMDSYNNFMPPKDHASGFPHVVIHKDNKIIPYSGDRSEGDIINWFKKHSSSSNQSIMGGGKNTLKRRTNKRRTKKQKNECENISASKYNQFLESKQISNKLVNKTDHNLFTHRGNIHNIHTWTSEMMQKYKNIKQKYSMKPYSSEWNDFKQKTKCNIQRYISFNKNIRVIGILSTPTYTDASLGATSFIPQSYVKWAELHGARILPIQYDLPLPVIDSMLEQINGLILIGGIIERNVHEKSHYKYLTTLSHMFKKIIHYNLTGNHFPIFSICLGFELLPMIVMSKNLSELSNHFINDSNISKHKNIDKASIQFCNVGKQEKKELLCDYPTQYFSKKEINSIEKTPITYFTHGKAFLMNEKYMKEYNKFLKVTATANKNGKKIVAMYQFKSFPFYGTQFHPEKSLYEWREEDISHSEEAIMFSKRLCKLFMNECDKNYNTNVFIGNNNNNLLIENYDLLSRDNVNKILYPHNNKNVNSDELGSTYYFGRIDNIKSELLSIPNITLEKSINSKRKTRRSKKSKRKIRKTKKTRK